MKDLSETRLENARRLVDLFLLRVKQLRAGQVKNPEHISTILQRIAEKERARRGKT